MKIRAINEKGIEVIIDAKELVIGDGTIEDLERDLVKIERMLETEKETKKRKTDRLAKIWEEIR